MSGHIQLGYFLKELHITDNYQQPKSCLSVVLTLIRLSRILYWHPSGKLSKPQRHLEVMLKRYCMVMF